MKKQYISHFQNHQDALEVTFEKGPKDNTYVRKEDSKLISLYNLWTESVYT